MKNLLMLTFATLALSGVAQARHPNYDAVDERYDQQQVRIHWAHKKGRLSSDQVHRLNDEGSKIRDREGKMRTHHLGDLSERDRILLGRDLDQRSRDIMHEIETGSR